MEDGPAPERKKKGSNSRPRWLVMNDSDNGRKRKEPEEFDAGAGRSGRVSGRLSTLAEVVPDWGPGEVVVSVRLWSKRQGEVDVATLRRRLDELQHPGGHKVGVFPIGVE